MKKVCDTKNQAQKTNAHIFSLFFLDGSASFFPENNYTLTHNKLRKAICAL